MSIFSISSFHLSARAKVFIISALSVFLFHESADATEPTTRAERIAAEIKNPLSKKVLVVAHRGDWRNWPENSLEAMQSAIDKGADIIELDIRLTKDSVLVVCHDAKLDRTTSGKGFIKDYTSDSIASLVLRTGHGIKTDIKMPTLRQALELCKGQAVVNIDKGYEFYDLALAVCEEIGVTEQVLIKGKSMPAEVARKYASHNRNMLYMPVIDLQKEHGENLYKAYKEYPETPLAYEICWSENTPYISDCMDEIIKSGAKLWVNTLWPSLNGGLCDDAAARAESPEDIYGKLVDSGVTMIQTDRIELLVDYLRTRGLHD